MFKILLDLIKFVLPPSSWKVPVLIAVGTFAGLGVFLLYVANAFSYLSDNPKTCINCHLMATEYATWFHSSHRRVASCNDCHVPQNNIFNHYLFKAQDGLRHSTIFTLRLEPQAIKIKDAGRKVVDENCKRCHWDLIAKTSLSYKNSQRVCWDCHGDTPHGKVRSLSAVPFARIPLLGSPVPDWLKNTLKQDNK